MKILLVHNFYQQPGGEDVVFRVEKELLTKNGHTVLSYTDHNDRVNQLSLLSKLSNTFYSTSTFNKISDILISEQPDIVHCHNTFPLISPSVYYACHAANIPVVQTLHNFRLKCLNALLFRENRVCEDCLGKFMALKGIRHKCYRDSLAQSTVTALMLSGHKLVNTWKNKVDQYIALTEFAKQKFIESGLPEEKIVVKPNFIDDPISQHQLENTGKPNQQFGFFVGRLSEEKGIRDLVAAHQQPNNIEIQVAGDGPLKTFLEDKQSEYIKYLGRLNKEQVIQKMQEAAYLIFPSTWYEGFPMVLVEALACGLPVIASKLGSMAEIIQDGYTGLHFTPGDAEDLAAKIRWANEHPEEMAQMGRNARKEYEAKYTVERNYEMLMGIYERVIERKKLKGKS